MKNYERPVMIRTEELAEGVYLASGGIKCDSVYMNGVAGAGLFRLEWHHTRIQAAVRMSWMPGEYCFRLRSVEPLCGFRVCGKLRCG